MQFIAGVKIGDFVEAHCTVVRETRSVLFIESKLKVGTRIVASASGIWKILGEGWLAVPRHPEAAAKRPSKGDGPGRASFEARFARTSG